MVDEVRRVALCSWLRSLRRSGSQGRVDEATDDDEGDASVLGAVLDRKFWWWAAAKEGLGEGRPVVLEVVVVVVSGRGGAGKGRRMRMGRWRALADGGGCDAAAGASLGELMDDDDDVLSRRISLAAVGRGSSSSRRRGGESAEARKGGVGISVGFLVQRQAHARQPVAVL